MDMIHIDTLKEQPDKRDVLRQYLREEALEVCFLYQSDFHNAKVLRDIIFSIFDIFSLPKIWVSRFILICDEINNNAIEYGSSEGELNKLCICVKKNGDIFEVHIESEDTGKGKSPKKAKDMEDIRNKKLKKGFAGKHEIRGRGLFLIIEKLVDTLYFKDADDGGLIV